MTRELDAVITALADLIDTLAQRVGPRTHRTALWYLKLIGERP